MYFQEINGHNEKEIDNAIKKSLKSNKPNLISCKTKIGLGSPNKVGKSSSHGAPLGEDEIKLMRKKLKWNFEPFEIPENILKQWREIGRKGKGLEKEWTNNLNSSSEKIKMEFNKLNNKVYTDNIKNFIYKEKEKYFLEKPTLATRQCSMKVIESITNVLPNLIGGSADLSGSNNTKTQNSKVINAKNFSGNYIHYGVREHAMAAAMNGMALYHNLIHLVGHFNIAIKSVSRLSALMGLKVIYIFSHDSIGLGEDGPTHQPIEQLCGLRAIRI